jgi:hypothetical protein
MLASHPSVEGTPDFLRLNTYLSKDGAFVTVWYGLLEPMRTEAELAGVGWISDMDLATAYQEYLFRGYIETDDQARVILRALRVSDNPESRGRSAQRLSHDFGQLQLQCDLLC